MSLELTTPISSAHRNSLNDLQNTAFTSLLMGVFLNSPLISPEDLSGISQPGLFSRYGESFRQSLEIFARHDTIEQVGIIHILQK